MRKFFLTAFILAASLAVASTGLALEKTAARMTDGSDGGWAAGTQTCTVNYYNTCNGWVWIWSGLSANDRWGVSFDGCGSSCSLDASDTYFWTAAPAGYGFTGTADVNAADANDCPGAAIASQALLPASGWNTLVWGVAVPDNFVISVNFPSDQGIPTPVAIPTDHPAAGPTGPAGCGSCYPTTRENHTYYYGTAASPLCPGSSLNDGICDAQWLFNAYLSCTVSVEDQSWGAVKNLYR